MLAKRFVLSILALGAAAALAGSAEAAGSAPAGACARENDGYSCASNRWSGPAHVASEVTGAIQQEDYPLLETVLADTERSTQVFVDGSRPVDAAIEALTTGFASGARNDQDVEARFARWRAAVPNPGYADIAQARFNWQIGEEFRNYRAHGVSYEDAVVGFRTRMHTAELFLRNAPPAGRATWNWSRVALSVANSTVSNLNRDELQSAATQRWPGSLHLYLSTAFSLIPKVNGGFDAVERFVSAGSAIAEPKEGKSLYARLYLEIVDKSLRPTDTKLDWGKMKASFTDLVERYPDPKYAEAYRSYACFYRDWDAYNAASVKVPNGYESRQIWLVGTNARICDKTAETIAASQGGAAPPGSGVASADAKLAAKRPPRACVGNPNGDPCEAGRWPSLTDAQGEIVGLYLAENFGRLEAELHEIDATDKHYIDGMTPADATWRAFNDVMNAELAHPEAEARLDRWRAAFPNSVYVDFAQSLYHYTKSTAGCGCSDLALKMGVRDAESRLQGAPAAARETFLWNRLMLEIALMDERSATMDEGDANSPYGVFKDAIRRRPLDFEIYERFLTALASYQNANWTSIEQLIGEWSDTVSANEGRSLYARLFMHLDSTGLSPLQMKATWPRMRASFVDLVARYPVKENTNAYLSNACHFQDWATYGAVRAGFALPALYSPTWIHGTNFMMCDRLAGLPPAIPQAKP